MNAHSYWQDITIVDEIVTSLQRGKIVAGTSDTIIGLIAPLTQNGFNTLNKIKGRADKPYLLLVGSEKQAKKFTDALTHASLKTLIKNCWPGPLTLIVPAKKSAPAFATSSSGTIAIRVPDHAGLQQIAHQMGGVFSTSANQTDQPVPETIDDLDPTIQNAVTLIIDDRERTKNNPSTILDCTGNQIKLIREGAYSKDMLCMYLPTIT
jgi:tRNA threonylcarbamoyl adenosine modification protein (Sua5/YciO/YrdC/YwlC family)